MKALIIKNLPIQAQGFEIDSDEELTIYPNHIVGHYIGRKDLNGNKAFGLVLLLSNGKLFIPTKSRLEAGILEGRLKTDLDISNTDYLNFEGQI